MLDFIFNKKKNKSVADVKEFIFNTFLTLTSYTYPYGTEDELVEKMIKLNLFPSDIQKDNHGNYFYKIGESRTMFTSHLDTASRDYSPVTHVIDGDIIKTNGDTILGADDKAGVSIMVYMINNKIPGLYYFFIGEEVGCVGSGLASKYLDFKDKYDRCISFDRRGLDSVITYQSSSRCCSDTFADQLAIQLNKKGLKYKKDDSGIYTDSAEFTSVIAECTNLSVGYYKEHTNDESQDISHLAKLAEVCLLVDWESLITKRDPSKNDYKSWGSSYSYNGTSRSYSSNWRERDSDYQDYGHGWGSAINAKQAELKKTYGYNDDFYDDMPNISNRTRRSGGKRNKKKSRQFYDNGDGLVELDWKASYNGNNKYKKNIYDWIKFKFLDSSITKSELEVIRTQYLDMSNDDDCRFYEIIKSQSV